MAFQITEIVSSQPEGILVKARYQDKPVDAIIPDKTVDQLTIDKPFQAEIGYDSILHWKVLSDFEDVKSGIWQEQDGIHLLGRVHNILDYGDGKIIIDVYMQNGSELFTVDLETVDDIPEANDGLEITVSRLYVYPNE